MEQCELRGREPDEAEEEDEGRLDGHTVSVATAVGCSSSRGGRKGWLCLSFSIGGAYVDSDEPMPFALPGDTKDGSGTYELLSSERCAIV